ncbi:MAG: hypothetical protein HY042_09285 [Spirochaetia bacterium]|nr:hypothetical protein [Spirochaetia bacterium]
MPSCIPKDDHADPGDAYSEIYTAIDYKYRSCGQKPAFPIVLPAKPTKYGTHLCALSIIRTTCPFTDYPLFCLEIYVDLPGIGP